MEFNQLTERDLWGQYLLKASDGGRFLGYYRSLEAIRPLLNREEWLKNVTGYYINVTGNFDAVRLSFFTSFPTQAQNAIQRFAADNQFERIEVLEQPQQEEISRNYGGEELRFRRFLVAYTMIGLEIMEANLLNARCLLATFRWQVMRARKPYKPHFLMTFQNQSIFYNSLPPEKQKQFWCDLTYWPNAPQVDWAHFLVNMVLGCDWNNHLWKHFLITKPPLSMLEVNEIIRGLGFQIPDDWHP